MQPTTPHLPPSSCLQRPVGQASPASGSLRAAWRRTAAVLLLGALAACGGGGSSAPTYPLRAAFDKLTLSGGTFTLTATGDSTTRDTLGDCSGTLTQTRSVPTSSTLGGVAVLAATYTTTINLSNCPPALAPVTGTDYYDLSYLPLAGEVTGGSYAVYESLSIPNAVRVGSSGPLGTIKLQQSSTNTTLTGRVVWSYSVESDTTDTAILNSETLESDAAGVKTYYSRVRYRVDQRGNLTLLSQEVVAYDATGAITKRLVFR